MYVYIYSLLNHMLEIIAGLSQVNHIGVSNNTSPKRSRDQITLNTSPAHVSNVFHSRCQPIT